MKKQLSLVVLGFVVFCLGTAGWLVLKSSVGTDPFCLPLQQTALTVPAAPAETPSEISTSIAPSLQAASGISYGAIGGPEQTIRLGSTEQSSEFLMEIELSTLGAGMRQVAFSRYSNRDPNNPLPQIFLSPAPRGGGREALSMANRNLVLIGPKQQLRLDSLSWSLLGQENGPEGEQIARFEATVTANGDTPLLRLTKQYVLRPGSYLLDCNLKVENLSTEAHDYYLNLNGPTGPNMEAFRSDMRKTMAGYRNNQGQVLVPNSANRDIRKLEKAASLEDRKLLPKGTNMTLTWLATVNKYFAAIVVPQSSTPETSADWINYGAGVYYPLPDDESTLGLEFQTRAVTVQPVSQEQSSQDYNFQVYIGPKDKNRFDNNPLYKSLGFAYVIDFMGCCCPASIIRPLAFTIMGFMKAIHMVIPNYGIAIIILVFLMRLAMHPITKKSQISMHKMSKMGPKAELIKKKYAHNKAEMNKQLMELYRGQGASPVMGFLPMMLQMPIWISLWSAVNTSIDLRGAAFLPFWITDLSMPDALIPFNPTIVVPVLGWKIAALNILPLLMGVAFYMQQKLMPQQATAVTNPQVAQQQKMMMIMMPIMFPLMLYNVPSGVNLYIMTSTFAGVLEQHIVRKHIREKEAAEEQGLVTATSKTGGKVKKKKPKPMFKNMK